MEEKKNIFRRLWDFMNDPRLVKPLLIAIPCLTLILVGLILWPSVRELQASMRAMPVVEETEESAAPAAEQPLAATPSPTAEPTPSPTPTPAPQTALSLRGNSVDRDLYIKVLGEDGRPVTGHTFTLDVRFPDGNTYSYDTEDDGSSYYLVRLQPGEYTVSMRETEGFALPEPIRCTVTAEAQYNAIEDIQTVADVKDVTEMSQDEVPEETSNAPVEVVPEIIVIDDDPEEPPTEEAPVLDESGEQVYTYRFLVGDNGYLLLSDTMEESEVLPVDEDGDGVPEYGMYLVIPEVEVIPPPEETEEPGEDGGEPVEEPPVETPPMETPQPYYVSVEIYDETGRPLDIYAFEEIPVTETVEKEFGWKTIDGREYFVYEDGSYAVGLKSIGGKLYYFSQYGVKASSVGIDVSFYNSDINWDLVKAQGVDFAIIRVGGRGWTSGALYDDCRTQEYLRGARAAGIKIGVYFYSTAVDRYEAVEEASVALSTIGGIPLDYPIFIDMEYSGEYPYGRSDQLSASQRTEIAIAFCETIRNSGYRPGVYASQNYYKSAINYSSISKYTIWLASYTRDNALPNFSDRYDIWQFTDRGKIDGISGEVDMNVIF